MKPILGDAQQLPTVRHCPICLAKLDGVTQVGGTDATPSPGDFTFCVYCGAPLRFTSDGFELIPAREVVQLDASNFDFRQVHQAVRQRRIVPRD